jgi:hypothetical protein
MSHAAKDTLIKSVVQAIPGFAMGVFKMSMGFCDQYGKLIREFWWGEEEGQRKVHWMSWESMINPKGKGGFGFHDLHLFNQAFLARHAWRLLQNLSSQCARILKAKYFPNGDILERALSLGLSS